MSLWSSIGKAFTSGIKTISNAATKVPFLRAVPGLGTVANVASAATVIGSLTAKTAKTAGRVIPGKGLVGKAATVGIASTAYGVGKSSGQAMAPVYDGQGQLIGYKPKRRRMNYGNVKAAKRAGRRIKGTIKLLHNLEKSLPHKVVHRRSK